MLSHAAPLTAAAVLGGFQRKTPAGDNTVRMCHSLTRYEVQYNRTHIVLFKTIVQGGYDYSCHLTIRVLEIKEFAQLSAASESPLLRGPGAKVHVFPFFLPFF